MPSTMSKNVDRIREKIRNDATNDLMITHQAIKWDACTRFACRWKCGRENVSSPAVFNSIENEENRSSHPIFQQLIRWTKIFNQNVVLLALPPPSLCLSQFYLPFPRLSCNQVSRMHMSRRIWPVDASASARSACLSMGYQLVKIFAACFVERGCALRIVFRIRHWNFYGTTFYPFVSLLFVPLVSAHTFLTSFVSNETPNRTFIENVNISNDCLFRKRVCVCVCKYAFNLNSLGMDNSTWMVFALCLEILRRTRLVRLVQSEDNLESPNDFSVMSIRYRCFLVTHVPLCGSKLFLALFRTILLRLLKVFEMISDNFFISKSFLCIECHFRLLHTRMCRL